MNTQDYIIVADGNFLVREIVNEAVKNRIIVALDAAADKLARIGITPHILLGDFDSDSETHAQYWGIHKTFAELSDNETPYTGNFGVTIVPRKNQDLTDLVKAIHYCDEQHAGSITIICALGGRLDHQETALRSLRTQYKTDRQLLLHTEQQTICFARDEQIIIKGIPGDKCGILAYPEGMITTEGLEYDVDNYALTFGFSESIANSLKSSSAAITVSGEALLVMPPLLQSQREFMRKSEAEKLEMQLRDCLS
jgi:thiamine pyrophosphokinase